jgi:alpha-D-xyloside xylohydrolase
MQFVPYLYAAYIRYHLEGIPPFRALVMDYPNDPNTWIADQEYLMGDSLLVAPLTAGQKEREIYLPDGEWFDFWTGEMIPGAQGFRKAVPLDRIPVYVKSGTLLPLAQPTLHTGKAEAFQLTVRVYGNGGVPAVLFEDDGSTAPTFTRTTLAWDAGRNAGTLLREGAAGRESYAVREWQEIRG